MDCLHMDDLSSESIDIAFDKSTLDAMIYGSPWNPPDDVIQRTSAFIKEVSFPPAHCLFEKYEQEQGVGGCVERGALKANLSETCY